MRLTLPDEHRVEASTAILHPAAERRIGPRVATDLPGVWREHDTARPGLAVLVVDLSVRGARIATWDDTSFPVGQQMVFHADPFTSWPVEIVRAVGGSEYGVRFGAVPVPVKSLLITTVGMHLAGRAGWHR